MILSSIQALLPTMFMLGMGTNPTHATREHQFLGPEGGALEGRMQLGLGFQSKEKDTSPGPIFHANISLGYFLTSNLELGVSGYAMNHGYAGAPFLRVMDTGQWRPSLEMFGIIGSFSGTDGNWDSRSSYGFGVHVGMETTLSRLSSVWMGLTFLHPGVFGGDLPDPNWYLLLSAAFSFCRQVEASPPR
jgi:hypothetical protein